MAHAVLNASRRETLGAGARTTRCLRLSRSPGGIKRVTLEREPFKRCAIFCALAAEQKDGPLRILGKKQRVARVEVSRIDVATFTLEEKWSEVRVSCAIFVYAGHTHFIISRASEYPFGAVRREWTGTYGRRIPAKWCQSSLRGNSADSVSIKFAKRPVEYTRVDVVIKCSAGTA